jgi:hypothetical protein
MHEVKVTCSENDANVDDEIESISSALVSELVESA